MKLHEIKFNEIKSLLKSRLGENVISYEESGNQFIEISKTKFWLTIDEKEFTVGYGLCHTHFSEQYGNLHEGIFKYLTY